MAEDITKRSIREILEELFKGRDSALEKYSKVLHTLYQMNLWQTEKEHGLQLNEVPRSVRVYFSQRYLNGKKICDASESEIDNAFIRLNYAAGDTGCKGRCARLVDELNLALDDLGLDMIKEPEKFIGWLTFDYDVRKDEMGNPVIEKPFSFEVRIFKDARNRKEFWAEVQLLMDTYGRMMSMQDVLKTVLRKRRSSVVLRD